MTGQRVCFVVSDLLGLVTNSGIGTATSFTSLVLASAGHHVTLAHTRDGVVLDPSWAERYRSAGVAVEEVPAMIVAPVHLSATYRAYEHLKDRDFDTIVFQDWLALGWASMQAKHAGLAFPRTQLIHISHGPDAWLHQANLQVSLDIEDLALAHAGQVSAELADTIVGPSRYLIDWMASAGWRMPERRFVVPYFTEGQAGAALGGETPADIPLREQSPLREIAFFGRLERRKGVQVFAAALNRVEPSLLEGITISFLGREATFAKHDVLAMFEGQVHRAVAGIEFHSRLDNEAAGSHLSRPGTLAVVASLVDNSPNTIYECIERGIPFLATTTGGTPELLHEEDRARCLVEPEPVAMAGALRAVLEAGLTPEPARPAYDVATSLRLWNEILAWRTVSRVEVREAPLVTAVLTHHERPTLITTAVEALDGQDYENLEIVLVDDGSERSESEHALAEIAAHNWRHELRLVRQENRYLGAARNAGTAAGRGDLVVFVDDDDVPMEHFVSTLARAIQTTGADAVTCAMRSFTKPLGAPEPADSRGTWVFAGGPLHLAAVTNCIGGAPAMVRRSALESIGGYHERHGVGYEDWHLYVRLLFSGHTIVAIPEPLYWYRLQANTMRSTMSDYHSAQVILDEFRQALPPSLRPLPGLAYGQDVIMKERVRELKAELGMRDRVLWLAEERLERLTCANVAVPSAEGDLGEGAQWGITAGKAVVHWKNRRNVVNALSRRLAVGRDRVRRTAASWVSTPDRPGQRGPRS